MMTILAAKMSLTLVNIIITVAFSLNARILISWVQILKITIVFILLVVEIKPLIVSVFRIIIANRMPGVSTKLLIIPILRIIIVIELDTLM